MIIIVQNALHDHEGTTIATHPRLPEFTDARLPHFEAAVGRLRAVFQRADQFLRCRAYLRGLLEPSDHKNVEALAAIASRELLTEANLPQALQHFVSHSPWPCERLFAAIRDQSRPRRGDAVVWVVQDTAFPKKGRHSVGVLRQLAREEGKKINCQVAVTVAQIGPAGFVPLAIRLYLPAAWLKANPEVAEKGVPEESRRFTSKGEIALALLDSLAASGETVPTIAAEGTIWRDAGFAEGVASRGWAVADATGPQLTHASTGWEWLKRELGLDHFEGRSWLGWHHHAALVFAAFEIMSSEGLVPRFSSHS